MNGLRQLRDATGGCQVSWKSPTVDDDETACRSAMPARELSANNIFEKKQRPHNSPNLNPLKMPGSDA